MTDVLDLKTRQQIYQLIEKNPGIHLSKIAELTNMRISHAEYHLLFLEKHELIHAQKEKGYKRFYVKGKIGVEEKRYLSVLRKKIELEIVLSLLKKNDSLLHRELLQNVPISASTLSYHLNNLVKKEILTVEKYGEHKGYTLKNRQAMIEVLIKYKPYNLFEGFSDIWVDLSI